MEGAVTFRSGKLSLEGILGFPDQERPGERGVVLVHGWGGYRIGPRRILVHMARRLNAEGFATLRFDLRGRGDSEGDGPSVCLDDMIEDALAAVDTLRREAGVSRLTLLGVCSGSNVSIGAATLRPNELRELALWSTLPFQPEQKAALRRRRACHYVGRYVRKALRPETWARLFRGEVDVRSVGKAISGDAAPASGEKNLKDSSRDIMSAFGAWPGRALFLTGSKDPEGMAGRELFQRFCARRRLNAEFRLIEGATHSFYDRAHERAVIENTVEWLKRAEK